MRLGSILVPSAIVVAIGVLVAAQAGWLDAPGPVPSFQVHGDPSSTGTRPAARSNVAVAAGPSSTPSRPAATAEPVSLGRSVSKISDGRSPAANTLGSGGASLDSDGAGASGAGPAGTGTAGASADALQQALDEAAKAKADVLDVTQASIAAQRASEADFERQKAELNEQIAQMRARIDAAPTQPAGSGATAQAEAKAATAMAELADARHRETTLRAELAAARSAGAESPAPQATGEPTASAHALAEAQGRVKDLEGKLAALQAGAATSRDAADKDAAGKLAAAGQARAEAQDRAKALEEQAQALENKTRSLEGKVAALQADAVAGRSAAAKTLADERAKAEARARIVADKVAVLEAEASARAAALGKGEAAERALAGAGARAVALRQRVVTLQAELAAGRSAAAPVVAKAAASEKLAAELDAARRREDGLRTQVASLQAGAEDAARAKAAAMVAVRAPDETAPSVGRSVATLQDDLAGARRGEDTLRRENGVLQRELAEQRASNRLIGEKLAALQVGMGQTVPQPAVDPAGRDLRNQRDHRRLVRQLSALQREQMHQEVQALKVEAADLGQARGARRRSANEAPDQGAHFATVDIRPDGRRSPSQRRREGSASHDRDAAIAPSAPAGANGSRTARAAAQDADDSGAVIAQATGLIRAGNIDRARALLRQHGGSATTRALADTYNPLTNTKYGAFGVDSDADKATYLYQQAARTAR